MVEREFQNEIGVAPAIAWWNYWDHEHLAVVHSTGYRDGQVLYEDDRSAVLYLAMKVPFFPFLTSMCLSPQFQIDKETMVFFAQGLFGIPSESKVRIQEDRRDHCVSTMSYRFFLSGPFRLLAPFLPLIMATWNRKVWLEDVPLKARREKVLRLGFKDFIGLPSKAADRAWEGDLTYSLPLPRPANSPVNSLKRRLESII